MAADFLLKRGKMYHFNMRVPDDLRAHLGKDQWRYSLKTKDRQEAIKLARQHAADKDRMIAEARAAMGGPAKGSYLLKLDPDLPKPMAMTVGGFVYPFGAPPAPTPSAQQDQTIAHDLAKCLSVVKDRVIQEKCLAEASLKDYNVGVRRFVEVVGDKDVRLITRSDIEQFKFALVKMPYTRRPKVLKMSVQEQIKWADENDSKRIGTPSVNKYLIAIQSILNHAHDRTAIFEGVKGWRSPVKGFIDAKPTVKQDSEEDDGRRPFTAEEIRRLFDPEGDFEENFVKGQTTRRWMAHIMRWTGLRLGETAQIRVSDIQVTAKGTHFVKVTNREQAQSVKREASRRHMPLHPELIALGLLDFVNSIKEKHGEDAWLFQDLNHSSKKERAKHISKAFLRWARKKPYITDPEKLGTHSLRHSFKTAGFGRVSEGILNAMCGHATSDPATATYIKTVRFDADRLWEEGLRKMPL
ncbi:tyrosine-type recombinase/integrase [Shimia sp. R9_1]|uniref:DUF6538 domain-containing protein n=1 Tax=Shimia sp. R9_1 TaxID=2821111 RepID=UPI001ADC2A69|nr:DUF6538 domain-containing protein [Shimia sp. R9_1]MBO9406172.1 tyrosine-type recombinase/integrase [Shimia sp. R9_1]